ncbi:MAG: HEAT repeat domain-containing protein, partial [Planctomycetota bacterium]|nr:HEAT repeat domain-containing protein [Planctomycetota bacterium]
MNQRRWLLCSFMTLLLLSQSPKVHAQSQPQKVAALVSELRSKDPKRRATAALSLGQLGQNASGATLKTIQQSLLNASRDQDWEVRASAYDGIKQLGSKRAQPLLPKLFIGLTDRYSDVA